MPLTGGHVTATSFCEFGEQQFGEVFLSFVVIRLAAVLAQPFVELVEIGQHAIRDGAGLIFSEANPGHRGHRVQSSERRPTHLGTIPHIDNREHVLCDISEIWCALPSHDGRPN